MIEGALILLAGILAGRFLPTRHTKPKVRQTAPVCGCEHGRHDHDPATGACNAQIKTYKYDPVTEREVLHRYSPCTCRQYTGPEPLPEYYAPEITG